MKLYMPSPEFHQSFLIGRKNFVLTFWMRSVVPIRGGSNQSMMSKYYSITTRIRKLLTLPPLYVHANCLWTVALDGVSIRKAATNRWRLTICTNSTVYANWEFALRGVQNSRFSTCNQNSSNKETTTHDRPCELLVNCEFALRGSDSFTSSEAKEAKDSITF